MLCSLRSMPEGPRRLDLLATLKGKCACNLGQLRQLALNAIEGHSRTYSWNLRDGVGTTIQASKLAADRFGLDGDMLLCSTR